MIDTINSKQRYSSFLGTTLVVDGMLAATLGSEYIRFWRLGREDGRFARIDDGASDVLAGIGRLDGNSVRRIRVHAVVILVKGYLQD